MNFRTCQLCDEEYDADKYSLTCPHEPRKKEQKVKEMKEELASLCHEQWSGWMKYLFNKSRQNEDGSVTIPKWAVDRWREQMNSKYDYLTEQEKESDRKEANKFLMLLRRIK